MRSTFLLTAALALLSLQLVQADDEKTHYSFGLRRSNVEQQQRPADSFLHKGHTIKSSIKAIREEHRRQTDIKKRVRFFVHEDGDLNLIDNQGNDYISTDEENAREEDDEEVNAYPLPSPLPRTQQQERTASWSAESRQQMQQQQQKERRLVPAQMENAYTNMANDRTEAMMNRMSATNNRQGFDFGSRTISSATMEYKRQLVSRIRMTESKIEFLLEMIAEQKQERCEAAKYNLLRAKLVDFRQQNRIWNARIKLLKNELERQEDELDYYNRELVVVQRRLQSALRQSQRLPVTSY